MTEAGQGSWRYLFVQQLAWEKGMKDGEAKTVADLEERLKGKG